MSKNTNLSFLTDYITADITNGRIGINNASPSYAFDVTGQVRVTGSTTASSALAQGAIVSPTLVAAANFDTLIGLDINPTFTNGSFTGVTNDALRVTGESIFTKLLRFSGPTAGNITYYGNDRIDVYGNNNFNISTNGTGQLIIGSAGTIIFSTGGSIKGRFFATTGNLLLQNGGTFTDAGYRLDVVGTTRIQDALTLSGSVTGVGNLSNYTVTASSGSAISKKITSTLISSASSDVLIGLDVAPTYIGTISVVNINTGGSGYVSGTYTAVPLTGGSGTGAQATIIITAGVVTSATITTAGNGYKLYENVSASNTSLGGSGSGLNLMVAILGNNVLPSAIRANGNIILPYDNTAFIIGNNADAGIVKKIGSGAFYAFTTNNDFTISQSNTTNIYPSNTFTNRLTINASTGLLTNSFGITAGTLGADNFGIEVSNELAMIKKAGGGAFVAYPANRDFFIAQSTANSVNASNTFNRRLTINQTSGNVLINTSTDAGYRLDVVGTTRFQGTTASDTAPLGSELAAVTGSGTNWALASGATNLNVGGYTHTVGSTTALTTSLAAVNGTYYQITYTITGRTAGSITIAYGGTSTTVSFTGNIGPLASSTAVLTITPTTDFDGTVVLSIKSIGTSSASSTFANSSGTSNIEVRASSIVSNTFIGLSAGNRNTTGSLNTFIGNNAGQNNTTGTQNVFLGNNAGTSNTIGGQNTFVGISAGYSNTTGIYNTFFGLEAGQNNTTGFENVFIGVGAGNNNTTSYYNTGIGVNAGRSNTTGVANNFFGNNAGRWIANGSTLNSITDNSIYIGYNTKALANNQTNQIVIGYAVTGLGSNTTVLGNSSTLTTAIYGNLLLGTTTDSGYKLDVTGTARVSGAATFSSSVTATQGTFSNTSGNQVVAYYGASDYLNIQHNGLTTKNNQMNLGTNLSATPTMALVGTNVGIGTTSPTNPLQVETTGADLGIQIYRNVSNDNGSVPLFLSHKNTAGTIKTVNIEGIGSGDMFFRTGATGLATFGTERMRITSGGQVGIGISSIRGELGSYTKLSVGGAGVGAVGISGSGTLDLGITIDQFNSGLTLLFLASRNTANGTSTASAVYIISFYYDGGNFPSITYIGGTNNFVSFGSSGGKLTATNPGSGNASYSWFTNR
jgi:hypothetical protein